MTENTRPTFLAPVEVTPARWRDQLLAADDPEGAIQAVAPLEFAHLVVALGREDAGDLLPLAAPEQLRVLADLDVWTQDRPDQDRLLEWLAPFEEAGPGRLARAFLSLDVELAALLLLKEVRVYHAEEDEDPGEGHELHPTPDSRLLVEILPRGERAEQLRRLLETMYGRSPSTSVRLLLAIRAAVIAELEEQALHWRQVRLAELGFPPLEEALDVFARPAAPVDGVARPGRVAAPVGDLVGPRLPVRYAEVVGSGGLLGAALELAPPAQAPLEAARLVALLNRLLAAERVEFRDEAGTREVTVLARDLIQLALEHLGADTPATAHECLAARGPKELFRTGYSLTAALAGRARGLVRTGLAAGDPPGALLDPPGAQVLAGLLVRRPRFCRRLDDPPEDGLRPFARVADLERTARMLDRLEAAARVVHRILAVPGRAIAALAREADQAPSLGTAFRTAVVQRALGAPFEVVSLTAAQLNAFRDEGLRLGGQGPGLAPELAARIAEGVAQVVAELPAELAAAGREVMQGWVDELVEELGAIEHDAPADPRFVGCVLVELPGTDA